MRNVKKQKVLTEPWHLIRGAKNKDKTQNAPTTTTTKEAVAKICYSLLWG